MSIRGVKMDYAPIERIVLEYLSVVLLSNL